MPTIQIIAYTWFMTVIVAIAAAAARGMPILHVFAPIQSWYTLIFAHLLLGLVGLEYWGVMDIAGYSPVLVGVLLCLVYAWVCIGYQLYHGDQSQA